ncbi:hypothetical protein [Pengzhenrongella sicca]|uniref:FtsX-like permease family protein n=1 Tax=Pengzhenrongella sicca TaxID=2819238 RepID=A0A8A4ZEE1_9MICO|nr:hypothetical protein [Pengzhenrongella sicca]QTE30342.1 hypothetical protein J4E96_04905 [Pengzhenrongella sicca]
MTTPMLLRRLIVSRWRQALLTAALVATLCVPLVVSAIVAETSRRAIETSAAASLGGYRYAIQVMDGETVNPVLGRRDDLVYVRDESAVASRDGAQVPTTVRAVSHPGTRLAELTAGEWPDRPGEVAVSRFVAESLGAEVGSEIELPSGTVDVVGLTASSSDRAESTVLALDESMPIDTATLILTNTDVFADPKLAALGNQQLLTVRTVDLRAADDGELGSKLLMRGLQLPWYAAAAVLAAVVLPILGLQALRTRDDVDALMAAGMGRERAARIFGYAAVVTLVAGFVLGSLIGAVGTVLARDAAATLVGQWWASVAFPWPYLAAFAVGGVGTIALVVLVAPSLTTRLGSAVRWRPRLRRSRAALLAASWVVVTGLWWMTGIVPFQAAGIWGGLAALVLPIAVGYPRLVDRSVARRRVAETVTVAMLPVVLAASGTIWLFTSVAASSEHEAISAVESSAIPQPAGSLLAYQVPGDAAAGAVAAYRALGGHEVSVQVLPRESEQQFRAASASLVTCMIDLGITDTIDAPSSCTPHDTAASVNLLTLSDSVGLEEVRADPTLIKDGALGILVYQPGSSDAVGMEMVKATGEAQLGGNMPGAVINPGSALAARLGMVPGDGRLVAFLDFGDLSITQQAQFRSALGRIAPAAQVAEEGEYYARATTARTTGRVAAVVGALIAVLVIAFGGGAVVAADAVTRRNLLDLSAVRSKRRALSRRLLFAPGAAVVVASLCGLGSAWILGVHDGTGMGSVWVLPPLAALAAWVLVVRAYMSTPQVQ